MSQLLSDLEALRRWYEPGPHRWTQGTDARDATGRPCGALDAHAVCRCLSGQAMSAAYDGAVMERHLMEEAEHDDWTDRKNAIKDALAAAIHPTLKLGIVTFNDAAERTFDDVMMIIDRAIDLQRERGA